MIESIKIRDFRGIEKGEISEFKKINLLVGPNNSGKSAVLEAIYLACTTSRQAGLNKGNTLTSHTENDSTTYIVTVADRDLLGDHPMQRIWAKHNYNTSPSGLGNWDRGLIRVFQKKNPALPEFNIQPEVGFAQGDEALTALFGLESDDRAAPDDEQRRIEIQQRIVRLQEEHDTPFETTGRKVPIVAEIQRLTQEKQALEAAPRNISTEASAEAENGGETDDEKRIATLTEQIELLKIAREKIESDEANEIKENLAEAEQKGIEIYTRQRERREKIKRLADDLMGEGQQSFEGSRLIYCWDKDLSYGYEGDAAWIVTGDIPSAAHTILYDVSNVVSHTSRAFFEYYYKEKPDWLPRLSQSFSQVLLDGKPCVIQFLPVPNDDKLVQAWVSADGQKPVPIDGYGDGARSAFKLLLALHILIDSVSEKEPGIVIWEEPELFQNPKTLGQLLKEVMRLVTPSPIQIFLASHSLEVPARFVQLVRREQLNENEVIVLITRLLNNELLSARFNPRNVEAWMRMHKDPRVPTGDADSPLTYQMEEFDHEFDGD